jgi:carbon-monoxide dehydrogenase medium subunit
LLTEPSFVVPATVEEAVAALADEEAVAVAGGTSIGLLVGQGLLAPSVLVWLGRIPEMAEVAVRDGSLVLGAGVTLWDLAAHPDVRRHLPALADAAGSVGNVRVRAVATVGGALVHADPRQDLPPVLIAYDAHVEVAGPGGRRHLSVDELATGFMSTSLAPGEVVTSVVVPLVADRRGLYRRFTPGSSDDYPTVGVAAAVTVAEGNIVGARVVVGGAGPRAFLISEADALIGTPVYRAPLARVAAGAAAQAEPVDDRLGSAAYKRRMAAVWVRRVLEELDLAPDTER